MDMNINLELAINGGEPIRDRAMPPRKLFGQNELDAIKQVFEKSWKSGKDFGFQGTEEESYTDAFCAMQGGGYADAVSSGTAALFISLMALGLEAGAEVIVSPVTDPGGISPIIFLDLQPVVADSEIGSWNISADSINEKISKRTQAIIVTHMGGIPAQMEEITKIAQLHKIPIIEDCSQAHGARYNGARVGTFGDIAIFSTMFSKLHATGGCGGIVFTKCDKIGKVMRSYADRGKPSSPFVNIKDPREYLFHAMNFNQDEISCAIGRSTLSRLDETLERRRTIIKKINAKIADCNAITPVQWPNYCEVAPFFHTLKVDQSRIAVSKTDFALALQAEGIDINPDYGFVISEWPWLQSYLPEKSEAPNATDFRSQAFNLLFNEQYGENEINDIARAIHKVESAFHV